jgi:hypothetical protein
LVSSPTGIKILINLLVGEDTNQGVDFRTLRLSVSN